MKLLSVGYGNVVVASRVVAVRLPSPIAKLAEKRVRNIARRKRKKLDPRTLEAAHFIVIFTTLPADILAAEDVLELYR